MVIFDRILIAMLIAIPTIVIGGLSFFWVRSHWYTDIRPVFAGKVVTDPDDPKFDPMQFRFEYYNSRSGNEWDLPKALIKMFPPGTNKTYIDKVLIEVAGARSFKDMGDSITHTYRWPSTASLGGEIFLVCFNEKSESRTFFSSSVRFYEDKNYTFIRGKSMIAHHKKLDKAGSDAHKYLESHMRPIRKKYLDIEDGILTRH